jgi:diguanylate cyclase (GGDEF)-like protein
MWARGVPISRVGTLDWENLGTDLALMSVGALGSLLWLTNPSLVPLCLGPLFLIYRSLLVPSLKEEARTDPKTELANMKHWNQLAQAEVERARRFDRPLSVLLADFDLLREINNRHGHLMGDQMIRRVADAIRTSLREYDVPARFGGDEFAVLMPETTLPEAMAVAERIRREVESIVHKNGRLPGESAWTQPRLRLCRVRRRNVAVDHGTGAVAEGSELVPAYFFGRRLPRRSACARMKV